MKIQRKLNNKGGFTLIEIIAVLVLLGILPGVALPKYVDMSSAAETRAVDAAIAELNGRESLTSAGMVLNGWEGSYDDVLPPFTDLGSDYDWASGDPTTSGGDLLFVGGSGTTVTPSRAASTATSPAVWTR